MTRPCQSGARLISWSQTEIDGRAYAPQSEIAVGAYWRWSGATVDFTVATDLGDWQGREDDISFPGQPRRDNITARTHLPGI